MAGIRRRDFLKVLSGGAGAWALGSATGCSSLDRLFGPDSGHYDEEVLIIGAGLAGLAAAHELKKRKVPYRVIETSSRPGGRVRTLAPFNDDGQFAELGAEFIDARHQTVFDLCSTLGLSLDKMDEPPGGPLFVQGGKVVAPKEIAKGTQLLLSRLIRERLRITGDVDDPRRAFRRGGGRRAEQVDLLSFQELLGQLSTNVPPIVIERFRQAARVQFGVEPSQQSCLHMLMSLDPESPRAGIYRVRGGTETLARALYERTAGVIPDLFYRFQTRMVSIRPRGSYYECRLKTPQGTVNVRTRALLFAIPPTALRLIDGFNDLALPSALKDAVSGWTMATHSRTVLSFRERFWNRREEGPGSVSLLGDLALQTSWDSSRGQMGRSGVLTFTTGGTAGANVGADAPRAAIEDLTRFWKRAGSFADGRWDVMNGTRMEGLGGSVTVFEPGRFTKWNGIFDDVPSGLALAFAGEHASANDPGTVQGAIESGQRAAAKLAKALAGPRSI